MVDTAVIKVKAGNGGDGHVSFRREKFIPKGGPDGGDGGKGGSVYFIADENLGTLLDFHSKPKYQAQNGEEGGKKKMAGKASEDLYVKVPLGTLVYEKRAEGPDLLIADLTEHGTTFLVAQGGRGGLGNVHFKSSTNQAPRQYVPGVKGQEKELRLEIKLVADVGLIGLPNAGKSTLLNHLTNSNAKVANYPFTTISPNLGVYTLKNKKTIVLADIPGLIEGASQGKGLGDDFLRHIERTRILVHVIDGFTEDAVSDYNTIRNELISYGRDLDKKPEVVVINKLDITEVKNQFNEIKESFSTKGIRVFGVSSATGEGVDDLMVEVMDELAANPKIVVFEPQKPTKTYTILNLPNKRIVFGKGNVLKKE